MEVFGNSLDFDRPTTTSTRLIGFRSRKQLRGILLSIVSPPVGLLVYGAFLFSSYVTGFIVIQRLNNSPINLGFCEALSEEAFNG